MSAPTYRCPICQMLHPSAAAAQACGAKGAPTPAFRVGQRVYPRYTGGNPEAGAVVRAVRVVKGTHDVEYAFPEAPDVARRGPRARTAARAVEPALCWVSSAATFPSAAARQRATEAERHGAREAQVSRSAVTPAMRASYARVFRQNRDDARRRQARGELVYLYVCKARTHGRAMRFFGPTEAETRCPACGSVQIEVIAVPVPMRPAPTAVVACADAADA